MLLVTWRLMGLDGKLGPEESREYPEEQLQELMDRINRKFGNPDITLDGPCTQEPKDGGLQVTPKPRRKK